MSETSQKLSVIPSAFGDSGGTGAKPPLPAPAGAAAASSAMSAPAGTTGLGLNRTLRAFYERG